MSKTHIYTVHINPLLSEPYESPVFIEEGFNTRAFIFSWIWALYYKLWWPALGLFVFHLSMIGLLHSGGLTHTGVTFIDLGVHVLIGFHANDWLRNNLTRRGYVTADIVSGSSLLAGQQRFFDHYFAAKSPAPFVA